MLFDILFSLTRSCIVTQLLSGGDVLLPYGYQVRLTAFLKAVITTEPHDVFKTHFFYHKTCFG